MTTADRSDRSPAQPPAAHRAVADPRHPRRRRDRRRVRRRVLGVGPRVGGVRAAQPGLPGPPRRAVRGLARPGRPRAADHPQARRRALRRDGRGRRVGDPRQPVGRRHAALRVRAGRGCRAGVRLHALPDLVVPGPRRRGDRERGRGAGSTTGSCTTRPSSFELQLARGVLMAISAIVLVAGGSVLLERPCGAPACWRASPSERDARGRAAPIDPGGRRGIHLRRERAAGVPRPRRSRSSRAPCCSSSARPGRARARSRGPSRGSCPASSRGSGRARSGSATSRSRSR